MSTLVDLIILPAQFGGLRAGLSGIGVLVAIIEEAITSSWRVQEPNRGSGPRRMCRALAQLRTRATRLPFEHL
jgi:hypothetical protein